MRDGWQVERRFAEELWARVELEAFGAPSQQVPPHAHRRRSTALAAAAGVVVLLIMTLTSLPSDPNAVQRLDVTDAVPVPTYEPAPDDADSDDVGDRLVPQPPAVQRLEPRPVPRAAAPAAARPPLPGWPSTPARSPAPVAPVELLLFEQRAAPTPPGRAFIAMRAVDGSAPSRPVVAGAGSHTRVDVRADGGRIVYQSYRADTRGTYLYSADLDGRNEQRLTFTARCGERDPEPDCSDTEPRWSPAGDAIVFTRGLQYPGCDQPVTGCARISLLDPRSRQVTELVRGWSPDWSPDGSQLVYVAPADDADGAACDRAFTYGCNGTLHVVNRDGTGRRSLGVKGYGPRWSPDGRRIVFEGDHASNVPHQAFVIEPDGSGLRAVLPPGHEEATWTRDGRLLSTLVVDNQRDVWISSGDGSQLRQLTSTPENECFPVLLRRR